jgi:hypothetical protein
MTKPPEQCQLRPLRGSSEATRPRRRAPVRLLILALIWALTGLPSAAKEKPPTQYEIPIPPLPDFSALNWLNGQWNGQTNANPPGKLALAVNADLEKRVLIFRGELSLPATETVSATSESWLGVLSANPDGSGFILRVFSSTGFITRYRVTVDGPEIRLNPEGGDSPPPGWLFRRVWTRAAPTEFTETVQAAPPGKSFFDYYTAKFTRAAPPAKTNSAP